jgi:hypothetical protein
VTSTEPATITTPVTTTATATATAGVTGRKCLLCGRPGAGQRLDGQPDRGQQ